MKFAVEKETWIASKSRRATPERRRKLWEYCENFDEVDDLPGITAISRELGLPTSFINYSVKTILPDYAEPRIRGFNRVLQELRRDPRRSWKEIARAAGYSIEKRTREKLKRLEPTLYAQVVDGRTLLRDRQIKKGIETRKKIRRYYQENPGTTQRELTLIFNCSISTVARAVNDRPDSVDTEKAQEEDRRWEERELVDFVTPDDEYLTRQWNSGRGIVCLPRKFWVEYRKLWGEKVGLKE